MSNRKIWLVDFPTYQYNEDVKDLALKSGLKIIDSKHKKLVDKEFLAEDTPKLTFKKTKSAKK